MRWAENKISGDMYKADENKQAACEDDWGSVS